MEWRHVCLMGNLRILYIVRCIQWRHLIPALNAWAAGHNTRPQPIDSQLSGHGCMDELITERTLICKLHGSIMRLTHLSDMLAMSVCATRHCQAPGRLVQELNVCTVDWQFQWMTCTLHTLPESSCCHTWRYANTHTGCNNHLPLFITKFCPLMLMLIYVVITSMLFSHFCVHI